MQINVYSRGRDIDALIGRCRELGVTNVAYACAHMPGFAATGTPDPEQLRADVGRLRDAGIDVPLALKWFGNDPSVVLDPQDHRRDVEAACRTIEAIGSAGIPTVLHYIDLARSPRADDDARYWDGLVGVMREIVAAAESADVKLANHAIWRCIPDDLRPRALADGVTIATYREFRPAGWGGPYLLTSAEDIIRLLEAVPSPANGVCFCTGMHMMGGDLPRLTELFAGKVFYAQMRDLRGRWPAAEEVFPGTGELDFAAILTGLRRTGYDGVFGPEHLGNPRFAGEDLEAGAVAYFQRLLATLPS